MNMTSKGQVTIPKDIREKAGFVPGDDLSFAFEDGKVIITRNGQAKLGDDP